ncbi:DUF637 domain-containing protein [Psychrobacter pygoscelis]|uniref:DUF637 domain-containing protein n=1 Tax=Psychrobacter pygoscelis TaxID=2488563 RepID=UPI0013F3FF4F|nr:DUF637 domain-containing protein [Psychrobacter pygoscelis]
MAQEDWDYEQEGLTPAGAALLTLAVAWAAGPTAAGIAESVGGVGGAAASAGFTSLSTQAAIALANNKGDIAKTLDDLASSDTVRATLTAALTAGALEYINTTVMPDVFKNLSIEDAKSLQGRLVNGTFEGTTSALVDTAINGGSLSDNLEAALLNSSVNAAHGFAASEIKLALNNDILRIISQAAAGCVAGELKRAECEAGAIGSGVGELAAEIMLDGRNPTFVDDKELQNIIELSKFIAGVSAAYAGYDVNVAIGAANTTVINNGVKDKALLKLENARKYLDDKSKQVLDKFIDAYKKGDIELAKKYKTQLDDAISDWASSGSYEILGVNPKAAVGAAVFAVGELVIPTNVVDVVPVGKLTKAGKALKLTEHAASSFQKSSPIIVSGTRAIDKSSKYEEGVRSLYNNATFSQRQYSVIINGVRVNGVADDVTSISGRLTAVEAKYVDDWNKSIRNPLSSIGDKPWAVSEQNKMVEQARKYSHAFEGGVIYHTNSTELASYYSQVFKASGVSNFKFIISPTK